jgi:hypothetical protein
MSAPRRSNVALQGKSSAYRQLWRVVDGAVFDALYNHPDYLTDKGRYSARTSINKRVVGAVLGFAEQSAKGRKGDGTPKPTADRVGAGATALSRTVRVSAVSKWRAACVGVVRRFWRVA